MVKGTSRQVIVVHAPEPKLFEQAIFILRDEAVGEGITDELLMKEAKKILRSGSSEEKRRMHYTYGALCAAAGSVLTASVWLVTSLI